MTGIKSVLSTVFKDISTTPAGYYDPARVVGYGTTVLGTLVFYFCILWQLIVKGEFNGTDFAVGMAGISTAVTASAAGVFFKRKDEIPYQAEDSAPMEVTGTQAAKEADKAA